MHRSDPADPIDPIESREPTEQIDSTDPFEAMHRTEPCDRHDHRDVPGVTTSAMMHLPNPRRSAMSRTAFRAAAESHDLDALVATLAPEVVFRSPVVFKPYAGRDMAAAILGVVMQVFEDFRYVDELDGTDSKALHFEARIGDRSLQGVDLLRFGPDDRVAELTVFLRPLSGALAARDAIGARLSTG